MKERDEYVKKMKSQLDRWNAEIDALEAKARASKAQAEGKQADVAADLKRRRDEVRAQLDRLGQATSDSWAEARAGFERSWSSLRESLDRAKETFADAIGKSRS